MKIETIDRNSIKLINQAAQAALETVARNLGISVEVQGGKFDPAGGTFTPKFVFSVEGSDRMAFDRDSQYIYTIDNGEMKSLLPSDYGVEFSYAAQTYKLVAINLRAPKFPLIGEDRAGNRFKFNQSVAEKIIKDRQP